MDESAEEFDIAGHLAEMDDEQLRAAMLEAKEDLERASREQPDSEWHSGCFAALLIYSRELSDRQSKQYLKKVN